MQPSNNLTIPLLNTGTVSAASTHIAAVDTKGFDHLQFDLTVKSGSAAETAVTTLRVCEADYDSTAVTAATDITAYTTVGCTPVTQFVGAAAVSTSAGFVLPARSSTVDNTYRFNIDLRGRKRYLALNFAPTLTCTNGGINLTATLGRPEESGLVATAATSVAGCRLIVSG
jgi:hypothetical protein